MSIYNAFDLLGGLGVFLFGMVMMNNNLTALAGDRLKSLLIELTKTKTRGYLTGLGVTIVNQSSSATTVLEAVLVGAGLMTFQQSLAVTLGAELGSTFLGQLFAFPKITRLATLFVALGFFAYLLASKKRHKSAANAVLGFGLLFLGMDLMSRSMEPLRSSAAFLNLMASVEMPLLGILVGLVFTMVVQSSGATTGLVIAMAISGTINLAQAVPINLGASIGTCITAIIGSLSLNREAKRCAYIHVVFQTMGVAVAYGLLMIPIGDDRLYIFMAREISAFFSGGQVNLPREIAMAHTLMPVLNHMLVIPLLPLIVKAFDRVLPPEPPKESFGPAYLNEAMLSEPSVALFQVKKEILRMQPIIEHMLDAGVRMFSSWKPGDGKAIRGEDKQIDTLRTEIVRYLTKLARTPLSESDGRRQVAYLFIASELENLADVIDGNIRDRAKKLIGNSLRLSEEGLADVQELAAVVAAGFKAVMKAFDEEDAAAARAVLAEAEASWELQKELRRKHFRRLNAGVQPSIETTEIHMDLLNHLQRVNRHVYHVAQAILELAGVELPEGERLAL